MKLLILSFAFACNLLFSITFLSLTHSIWQQPLLQLLNKHNTALKSSGIKKNLFALKKKKPPSIAAQPITMLVESYATHGSFQQILEETKITPSPTSAITPTPSIPVPSKVYPAGSFADVYKQAGEKFGVPWQILYGIHMTETGGRNGAIFNYSGSGAQGPMQFKPSTWRAYEVDGDGDGTADINNAVDAIYTAANFLARHGSVIVGLHAYGGNTSGVLAIARSMGYTP